MLQTTWLLSQKLVKLVQHKSIFVRDLKRFIRFTLASSRSLWIVVFVCVYVCVYVFVNFATVNSCFKSLLLCLYKLTIQPNLSQPIIRVCIHSCVTVSKGVQVLLYPTSTLLFHYSWHAQMHWRIKWNCILSGFCL